MKSVFKSIRIVSIQVGKFELRAQPSYDTETFINDNSACADDPPEGAIQFVQEAEESEIYV